MDRNNPYYAQVELLVRALPFVFQEQCFALKGGTAINLFMRDFPRLSVDIDLVYLGEDGRDSALKNIHNALDRIAAAIEDALPGCSVTRSYQDKPDALRLVVSADGASIKIELSPVLRSVLHPPQVRAVVSDVEAVFGFAEALVVAPEDLYAGKICAALDRQHPRDLFDVLLLLENEGINEHLRKAFLVYLISHTRPMEELLAPRWKALDAVFENEFRGMAFQEVDLDEIAMAGKRALEELLSGMTEDEKRFLLSLYEKNPDWDTLGLDGVCDLSAVKWKLRNIERMPDSRRRDSLNQLRQILGVDD